MLNLTNDVVKSENSWVRAVRDGSAFEVSAVADGAYALPAYASMVVKANATTIMHFMGFFINTSNQPALISFYETPTITGGTPASAPAIINRNRQSTTTSGATLSLVFAPSAVSGTLLTQMTMFAGANAINFFNQNETPEEWVLKPNTNYAVVIRNNAATAMSVSARMLWFEV